jgi:hypothetical protein
MEKNNVEERRGRNKADKNRSQGRAQLSLEGCPHDERRVSEWSSRRAPAVGLCITSDPIKMPSTSDQTNAGCVARISMANHACEDGPPSQLRRLVSSPFLRNVGNRVLGEEHSLHQMLFSIIMTEYKRSR